MRYATLFSLFCLVVVAATGAASAIADPYKVAAIEFNPAFKQREQNFPAMATAVRRAAAEGAKLILFPEMGTTGYLYGSRAEIAPFVDTIPGKTTGFLEPLANELDVHIVTGMPEVDADTGLYYNAAVLIGPDGLIGKYRKNNLFLLESGWAAQGNLGVPVFDTPLGKLSIIICYDDYYYQSARLAALKGANVLAFIASSGRLLDPDPAEAGVHISISDVQQQAVMNGLYVVATNRNDIERNETLGIGVHYLGGASIWDPDGNNLAQAPVSTAKGAAGTTDEPTIIYADVDPTLFENQGKELLSSRRPDLYGDIMLNMSPRPMLASKQSHRIGALAVQYEPVPGDLAANKASIDSHLEGAATMLTNLIVMPENSLTGSPASAEEARQYAGMKAEADAYFGSIAKSYATYVVYSVTEEADQQLHTLARLLDPEGNVVGQYRKTHPDAAESAWLTGGDALPVFSTEIGRIGILFGGEARYPEAADVLSVNRADIIAMPAAWDGQFGRADGLAKGFLAVPYPENTNVFWYNTAKTAQAYLIVANFVGSTRQYKGSSGLYSLDPTNGYFPPTLASAQAQDPLPLRFQTIAPTTWWTSQQYIIDGRRPSLYVPLILDQGGDCFTEWQTGTAVVPACWQ